MNWKKSLCVAILTAAALAAMAGCGTTEATVPAAAQTASTIQSTPSAARQTLIPNNSNNGTMPQPPSGNTSGEKPAAPAMDLAAAAAKLGITLQQLSEAIGNTPEGFPDLAAAANKLGITQTALREALGFTNNGIMAGGPPPGGTPPAGSFPAVPGK